MITLEAPTRLLTNNPTSYRLLVVCVTCGITRSYSGAVKALSEYGFNQKRMILLEYCNTTI